MTVAIRVTYRHMDASLSLDSDVERYAGKLAAHFLDLNACHVIIEQPMRSQQKGAHFRIIVALTVPGNLLVVARDPDEGTGREDAHLAVHEAFRLARRELERWYGLRPDAGVTSTAPP